MIAFITQESPTSQSVRGAIHQLLEQKIPFQGWESGQLSQEIPADLDRFDAAIVSESFFRTASEEEKNRLQSFAAEKYLYILPVIYDDINSFHAESMLEIDLNMFAAQAALAPQEIPPLPDEMIIRGCTERIEEFWDTPRPCICEYHLHCLESALALENTPFAPPDWSEKIDRALLDIHDKLSADGDHDQLCGASLMELCARRCHLPEAAEKMFQVVEKVLSERPRTPEGFLSMGGDKNDPLFLKGIDTRFFGQHSYTTAGRNLITNELFHFYGGIFAACAAAGKETLLDEAVRIMDHIDSVHRDKDGLLFHSSRFGEIIGSKWGRGNTHAMLGAYYMLRRFPEMPQEIRRKAMDFLTKSLHALKKVQSPSGLWHNVLDNPATPEETSCSVIITFLASWCLNRGALPAGEFLPMIQKSRNAIKRKFWHGFGSGNCLGSFPAYRNEGYYLRRRIHSYTMPLITPALLESAKALNLKEEK